MRLWLGLIYPPHVLRYDERYSRRSWSQKWYQILWKYNFLMLLARAVSALIHAATMVAAGVYLVGRIFTLLTPEAQMFIAFIGCITLTMAALIAMVQTDIKRVLAFSTLSQLGYMIFAMGIGAWIAALFHLLTHAFFKAMLFLGSGQVIEGCHHEQEMTKMGGLWRKMPGTAFTFFIAVLAISGAGIPWTSFGIGGFYSKDEILEVAFYRHERWLPAGAEAGAAHADAGGARVVLAAHGAVQEPGADEQQEAGAGDAGGHAGRDYAGQYVDVKALPTFLLYLPLLVAYITPFYMGRCFMLTFMGKPRDKKIYEHAHESKLMVYPLFVLAAMTLISGWFVFRNFVAYTAPYEAALVPMIDGHDPGVHAVKSSLAWMVGFAFIVGLGLAYLVYRNGFGLADRIAKLPVIRAFHNILWNKFYFDHVYNAVLVMGTRAFAVFCGLFDGWVVDGIVNTAGRLATTFGSFIGIVDNKVVDGAVNGTGAVSWSLGGVFRGTHTGVIRNYILMTAIVVTGVILAVGLPALLQETPIDGQSAAISVTLRSAAIALMLVVLAACTVAAPRLSYNVVIPVMVVGAVLKPGRAVLSGLTWDGFFAFVWSLISSASGLAQLALLLIIFAVLYIRYRGLEPPEPEYAAAS